MLVRLRAAVLGNIRLRRAYSHIRGLRVLGGLLGRLGLIALPRDSRLWIRMHAGFGNGMMIQVDPRYDFSYMRGDHEPWLQSLLGDYLRAGDTYCDVGAHIGFFVMGAARLVTELGAVIALEPDGDNFYRLRMNIERNGLRQVTALHAAAWNSNGTIRFLKPAAASGRSEGHVVPGEPVGDPRSFVEARSVRLDEVLPSAPTVVKIDVEGAELEVLDGARRTVEERRTVWIIEIHNDATARKAAVLLTALGYEVEDNTRDHSAYTNRQRFLLAKP